ncbi:MAG: zinc ribbon domain-containing protein [Halodesulfurarchaeum sp.]
MATWEWIVLGLVLLAVAQLVALRFARRASQEDGDGPTPTPGRGLEGPPDPGSDSAGGDTVPCPHCGATNEAGYKYCRQCVSVLP